eukprot:1659761-Pleurochrysis_carterae.AAC.1
MALMLMPMLMPTLMPMPMPMPMPMLTALIERAMPPFEVACLHRLCLRRCNAFEMKPHRGRVLCGRPWPHETTICLHF